MDARLCNVIRYTIPVSAEQRQSPADRGRDGIAVMQEEIPSLSPDPEGGWGGQLFPKRHPPPHTWERFR